jgi:hypothetical protein
VTTQLDEFAIAAVQGLINTLEKPAGALDRKMAKPSSSNNPAHTATLAHIWGFPLFTMERQFNFLPVQMFLLVLVAILLTGQRTLV